MFLWAPLVPLQLLLYRIKNIPATAFQDLHSLEWIKLYNNLLTTLHYELMEPVLDTLQHIDIHSEYKNPELENCILSYELEWIAVSNNRTSIFTNFPLKMRP